MSGQTVTPAPTVNEPERLRVCAQLGLRDHQIPKHMHSGLMFFLTDGVIPGSFLLSVLSGDWHAAELNADTHNRAALDHWREFVKDCLPESCHGHPRKVADWSMRKGLKGGGLTTTSAPLVPRMSARVVISCASDAFTRIQHARRKIEELKAGFPEMGTVEDFTAALNDLAIAQKSIEAIQAEASKAVR